MKKILSVFITAAMLISAAALPVSADYTAPEESYDVAKAVLTFDDGTETNDIDSSAAKKVTAEEVVFSLSDTNFDKEFFLSMDVRYDDAAANNVTINRNGKVGPQLMYKEGKLVNVVQSEKELGAIELGKWYTFEFNGKMSVTGANVEFRVYDYTDGSRNEEPIIDVANLDLRNFYGGTTHGSANRLLVTGASVDNIAYTALNPNEIRLTSTADEINAGSTASLDYTMYRENIEYTKYPVTWSVYNDDNSAEITDGSVTINNQGVLIADIKALTQTVTVRASVPFGEKTLIGTKQIVVKAVDTSEEKFDNIVINGSGNVKGGTEEEYTVTATKNGEDVTDTIADGDLVWSIYSYDDLSPNNNKAIKIDNGKLTLNDSVLPQNIYIRATSVSGNVYGSKMVTIGWSDAQVEEVILSDPCEVTSTVADKAESWDGSGAYLTTAAFVMQPGNTGDYVLTELDVKFSAEGSGFELMRRDLGRQNTAIKLHNGSIASQSSSSGFSDLVECDTDAWYHFEVMYSSANADASINIYKYDENGQRGEKFTRLDISRWQAVDYGALRIPAGTYVDNIKLSKPAPNELALEVPRKNMFAGESLQAVATALRDSLPIKNATGLKWEVLDEEGLPIIDDDALVNISGTGLLTVDAMAPAQKVTIKVSSASGQSAEQEIVIQTSELFEIKNISVNEEKTKITKLTVNKKFNYSNEVLFIIAVHGSDGALKGVVTRPMYGDGLALGENNLSVDFTLPTDFNPDEDKISVMTWTMF